MNSIVMASANKAIKIPINEPAVGRTRSQIEEFVDFHGGPGVQLLMKDIVSYVSSLRDRGAEFIKVPDTYYEVMRKRLTSNVELKQGFEATRR